MGWVPYTIGVVCVVGIIGVVVSAVKNGQKASRCNEAGGVFVQQHGTGLGACMKSDAIIDLK